MRCGKCGLTMLNPQPDDATLASIYDEAYFIGSEDKTLFAQASELKRNTARLQLAQIAAHMPAKEAHTEKPRMLEVGCGLGNFMFEAQRAGFDVHGLDVSASAVNSANDLLGEERAHVGILETADFTKESFDIIVLADVIEHARDPIALMKSVRALVKQSGMIFIALPSLDSLSARLMGRHWMEFKREHLFYFDRNSLQLLLKACGFEDITIYPGQKSLNLRYIINHFEKFPVPILTPLMRFLGWILPQGLLHAQFHVVASGINAMARPQIPLSLSKK